MNKMEKALQELSGMDELAALPSPVRRRHPLAKLLVTVIYILVTVSFHKYDLTGLFPMLLWPLLLYQISGIPVRLCFYRLRVVLPLVLAVGLFNPFFDRAPLLQLGTLTVSGGVVSMLTLMCKGVFCLMASFLLMATTPADSLCAALRKLHVPGMLVTLFLLTYRYIGVLTGELAVMTDAYHLRAPGQKGIRIDAWGSFLGQLLLRSMDRAKELYASMLLRGYHEHFHYAEQKPFAAADAVLLLAGTAFCLLLRIFPVAEILGRLAV